MVLPAHNSPPESINSRSHLTDQVEVVPIQPKGSKIPLYLIHEIFGGTQCYVQLSHALGDDQPLYAFRSFSYYHGRTIEEIAYIYLRHLRALDPAGPYLLGGYSFGGLIAFEMARQLYEDGQKTHLVLLFDSWIQGANRRLRLRELAKIFFRNTRSLGARYAMGKFRDRWRYYEKVTENVLFGLLGSLFERINLDRPCRIAKAQTEKANRRALSLYRPGPYEGPVLLMVSGDRQKLISSRGDPFQGWGILAGKGLDICPIPSDHAAILYEPCVQIVARIICTRLSRLLNQQVELEDDAIT